MTADIIDLIIRWLILLILIMIGEVALKKKLYVIGFLSVVLFANTFRATLLRAISLSLGVFKYESPILFNRETLQSGFLASVLDFFLLLGLFGFLLFIIDKGNIHNKVKKL